MTDPIQFAVILGVLFCVGSFLLYSSTLRDRTVRPETSALEPSEKSHETGANALQRIFWTALVARWTVAALVYFLDLTWYFAPDGFGYEMSGRGLAGVWRGNSFMMQTALSGAQGVLRPYHYYNGVMFLIMGDLAPIGIRALNAVVGAAAVFWTYRITSSIFDARTGIRASWVVGLMPSLVLWSSVNCRDAWAILAILGATWAAMELRKELSLRNILGLVLMLMLLGAIRGYMFLIISMGILLSYVVTLAGSPLRNFAAGAVAAVAFAYLYHSMEFGKDMIDIATFENLNATRQGMAEGGSVFHENVDISTPTRALSFLPIGVTYFLFAPFPWQLRNFRQALTLPEMIFWWYLAWRFLLPGIRLGLMKAATPTFTLLCVCLPTVISYGLVEGNVGTAYRHRAQVLSMLLILAVGGWVAAHERRIVARLHANDSPSALRT